jgi:hypothetical protein
MTKQDIFYAACEACATRTALRLRNLRQEALAMRNFPAKIIRDGLPHVS